MNREQITCTGSTRKEVGALDLSPQSWNHQLSCLGTRGEPQCFHLREQSVTHSCPRLDQIGKSLRKHFPLACWYSAKELAHAEPKDYTAACTRNVF